MSILLATQPIVDKIGRPTPGFRAKWQELSDGLSGLSAWGVIDDYTIPSAVVSRVVDVSAYDEIFVQFIDVTASASSQRGVQVSVDGGATYYTTSGDYTAYDNTGVGAGVQQFNAHSTGSTAARGGGVWVIGLRGTGPKVARVNASSGSSLFVASNNAVTHIRAVTNAGVSTMNAGRIITQAR